jgi:hypothetical protein
MYIKCHYMPVEMFDYHLNNDDYLKHRPISLFNDYPCSQEDLNQNPYNFLILTEPNELFGLHTWAKVNHQVFSCILTWNEDILNSCSNSILLPYGMSNRYCRFWDEKAIIPEFRKPSGNITDKKFNISFLCGKKHLVEGHYLRHDIFNNANHITNPINFIYSTNDTHPWENGKDICWESMFHIAVENTKHNNYFTEKIVDAFLTKTIPIYWGCPNLKEYFNMDGIITFNNTDELIHIVNNLTPEFYESKKEAINENFQLALHYGNYLPRVVNIIKEICQLNNI